MNVGKRVTIKEVAENAGVTIGTVSNVINGTANVSDKTAQKVHKAIEELNYIPNEAAKRLRSKRSKVIGVVIPNMNNSFYSMTTSVFADEAYKHGYSVQLLTYEYSLERELNELHKLESNQVDILVLFNGSDDEKELTRFVKKGISVILVDRDSELEGVSSVTFDNEKVLNEIIAMLKYKGYDKIGYISEELKLTNIQDRYQGYVNGLKKNGYQLDEDYVFIDKKLCLNNLKNGYECMKSILETHCIEKLPKVWIATSDLLAIGVMRAINEQGFNVPRDFGVIGFDDTEISGYVWPRLTTVRQDQTRLGKTLWEVVKKISSEEGTVRMILQQELVKRDSC